MEKIFGIDVSHWQGKFNFAKAKNEGIRFAILKAGGSDGGYYKDSKFESYYKDAKEQGLNVGAYYFSTATTEAKGKAEAEKFISYLKGKQFEMPVYIDVENSKATTHKKNNKANLTKAIIAFCSTMEKAGYFVEIYANLDFFSNYMNDKNLQKYAHWVAQWSTSCTYKGNDGVLGMWQFGGSTNLLRSNKIAGVVCDQDYAYKDYPTIIKQKGLNGYKKEKLPSNSSSNASVSNETTKYYKKYTGKSVSIVEALISLNINHSFIYRSKIARANGIKLYLGLASQNTKLLDLLKEGKLKKV